MKGNTKNLIIIAIVLVIVGVAGYMYTTRDQSSTNDMLLTSDLSTTTSPVDGDLLDALRTLRRLKLDNSIFTSPVWLSLTDFGKTIAPEQPGRPNPFSPLDPSVLATTTAGH